MEQVDIVLRVCSKRMYAHPITDKAYHYMIDAGFCKAPTDAGYPFPLHDEELFLATFGKVGFVVETVYEDI